MLRSNHPASAGILAAILVLSAMMPGGAAASGSTFGEEPAREFATVGDIVLVRPVMGMITGLGVATFTASLPFSALGGNVDEAAETLVRTPARNTFLRCIACTPAEHERKRRERRIRIQEREQQAQ